jgi:transposase-like protein
LVVETGRPIAEVARDLGVNDGTLGDWGKAWRDANPESEPELSPVGRARMTELEEEIRRLRMENEFLKSRGLLRPDASLAERCALIEAEKANYPITWMCRQLGVARSSFYAWPAHRRRAEPRRPRVLGGAGG